MHDNRRIRKSQRSNVIAFTPAANSAAAVAFEFSGEHAVADFKLWLNHKVGSSATTLADLAGTKRWVAWCVEIPKGGTKPTKIPKNPATDGNAMVPTNPATYGTRAAAERRWSIVRKRDKDAAGGIGFVLGKLDNRYFGGIDLDNCIDAGGTVADWAQEVIDRFDTYGEISPSGSGVKLFFQMDAPDWARLLDELLGTDVNGKQLTRKAFVAGEHREVAIDTARFYAVTGRHLDGAPEGLRTAPYADVEWFIGEAGPAYLARQRSNGRVNGSDADLFENLGDEQCPDHDESGSAKGFRFMRDHCHPYGMSFEQAREAILADTGDAGEWANRVDPRQHQRAYDNSKPTEEPVAVAPTSEDNLPVDLWEQMTTPALPKGLLPSVIENFAFVQGGLMGCDPAGLAMAALTVCAASISDDVKIQVKRHDLEWFESTRLWCALVGEVSAMKTPILKLTTKPIMRRNAELAKQYRHQMAAYDELDRDDKKTTEPPKKMRAVVGDATPEATGEFARDSPDGLLLVRDELGGFFGNIEKYSGHKGSGSDRAFWLSSFNGGEFLSDRIVRGENHITNLSINVLGGIQPDRIRALVAEGDDDGLVQRLCPIMLHDAELGHDAPVSPVVKAYFDLVDKLPTIRFLPAFNTPLKFDDEAQTKRQQQEPKHRELTKMFQRTNKKLAGHVAKYNGIYARLCLLWHCIEHHADKWPTDIDAETAQRVVDFLHKFLLPHAEAFYESMTGLSDDHERLLALGGYILTHKPEVLTNRDIVRSVRSMRGMTGRETLKIFEQLETFGWIIRVQQKLPGPPSRWRVNPAVHTAFVERAQKEAKRRQRERELFAKIRQRAPR